MTGCCGSVMNLGSHKIGGIYRVVQETLDFQGLYYSVKLVSYWEDKCSAVLTADNDSICQDEDLVDILL
jgi:hypothetical protein